MSAANPTIERPGATWIRTGTGEALQVEPAGDAPEVVVPAAQPASLRGRWTPATRQIVAATVAALAAAVAAVAAVSGAGGAAGVPAAALCGVVLVSLVLGAGLGRVGHHYAGLVLTAVPVGLSLPIAITVGRLGRLSLPDAGRVALLVAWLAVGAGIGLGWRHRAALAGAVVGVALTGLALALGRTMPAGEVDALVACAAVVACGLLPWRAMAASGLTGLDDAVRGAVPAAPRARVTLDEAFGELTWSTLAIALTLALAASGLVSTGQGPATTLGLVVVVIVALRTRSLPLSLQVAALWAAAVVPLAVLLAHLGAMRPALAATLAVGGGLVMAVAGGLDLSDPERARLRRLGDLTELVCALAVLPLTLAVFGVLTDLVRTW